MEFVYGASANFGQLFNRDWEIAEELVRLKQACGYPRHYMTNTQKNATERIFRLSKLLHDAGLSKGATLSMQSWNEETLVQINRANIRQKTYRDLQAMFRRAGMPTYAELILGLPGETLDSFCAGIDQNIEAGQHDGLLIYLARVLPGSEMADPAYRKKHGIITRDIPIQASHGDLDQAQVGPTECEETVIGTSAMSTADWLEAVRVAWFVETMFVLGAMRLPLLWLHEQHAVRLTGFARWALRASHRFPLLRGESTRLELYLSSLFTDDPVVDRRGIEAFLRIRWPIEEASWLALMLERQAWLDESRRLIEAFCDEHSTPGTMGLSDAFDAQHARLRHWTTDRERPDPNEFARHWLWYGRRGGSMLLAPRGGG